METAWVINQTHRTDRWESIQEDFKDAPFILKRTEGVQMENPFQNRIENKYDAVALTHIEILKKAKSEGLKTVLILEDDCVPLEDYKERWIKIKEYLDTHLDEWETFNGGQLGIQDVKKVIRIEKNNLLLQAYGGSNSHWMYFNIEPTLEKLLTLLWWPHKWAIDIFYPMKCKNYACYPFLGEQSDGYSDISHLNRDWSEMYKITRHTMKRQLRQYL